jgi:tRNA-binding protein
MPLAANTGLRPGNWKSRIAYPLVVHAVAFAGTPAPHWQRRDFAGYTESQAEARTMATIEDFEALDIRVGRIVDAKAFSEAKKPAYRLWIDFGDPLGTKQSSAQITVHYKLDQLIGKQVLAVVNFPPRKIGPFMSEVLTLGVPDEDGAVVLLKPEFQVPNGGRMY